MIFRSRTPVSPSSDLPREEDGTVEGPAFPDPALAAKMKVLPVC
jgi:hypothetical protein